LFVNKILNNDKILNTHTQTHTMAYYGGYGNYPGQFMSYGGGGGGGGGQYVDPSNYAALMQQQQQQGNYGAYGSSGMVVAPSAAGVTTSGAPQRATNASYFAATTGGGGGGVNSGQSYSTASENDFNSLPVVGNGNSNNINTSGYYNTNTNQNMSSYATGYGSAYPAPTMLDPISMAASYGMSNGYPMMSDPYGQQYAYTSQQYSRPQASYSAPPPVASYSQATNTGAATLTTQQQQHYRSSSSPRQTVVLDEFSQLAPQIEAAYEAATHHRRQPVIKRQVITVRARLAKVQQVVRRLPTPTPDIVERVFIVKPQRDIVNLVIERPGTPPAHTRIALLWENNAGLS
jgi:hypothetical protein